MHRFPFQLQQTAGHMNYIDHGGEMKKSLGKGLGALIRTGLLDGDESMSNKGKERSLSTNKSNLSESDGEENKQLTMERDELKERIAEMEEERKQLIRAMDMMESEIESMIKEELSRSIEKERERIEEETRLKFEIEYRDMIHRENKGNDLSRENFEEEIQRRLQEAEERIRDEVGTIIDATEAQVTAEKDAQLASMMAREKSRIESEMRAEVLMTKEKLENSYREKEKILENTVARELAKRERELRRSYGERMAIQQHKSTINKENMNKAFGKKKFFYKYREIKQKDGPIESLSFLNQGFEMFPEDEELFCAKADHYLKMGYPNLADAWSRRSLGINPQNTRGWITHAAVLEKKGDLKGAEDSYRNALTLDPDNPDAKDRLTSIKASMINEDRDKER